MSKIHVEYGNRCDVRAIISVHPLMGCRDWNPGYHQSAQPRHAVFLCAKHGHIQIMVGRAGELRGSPGSLVTGSSNPVRLTTIRLEPDGGDSQNTKGVQP